VRSPFRHGCKGESTGGGRKITYCESLNSTEQRVLPWGKKKFVRSRQSRLVQRDSYLDSPESGLASNRRLVPSIMHQAPRCKTLLAALRKVGGSDRQTPYSWLASWLGLWHENLSMIWRNQSMRNAQYHWHNCTHPEFNGTDSFTVTRLLVHRVIFSSPRLLGLSCVG
jgi:hypothetical protein